jgi:hypothetical protein
VVVGKAYDFVLWLLPRVETFPRSHRFTIGERLSAQGLDMLVILTEAAYTTNKDEVLAQANRKINSTRLLLRLAKDLNKSQQAAKQLGEGFHRSSPVAASPARRYPRRFPLCGCLRRPLRVTIFRSTRDYRFTSRIPYRSQPAATLSKCSSGGSEGALM